MATQSSRSQGKCMRRVVFNQKGGVGKTSITCNIAAAFAAAGMKTLVVDLDAQGNTSHYLLCEGAIGGRTVTDFFESTVSTLKLFGQSLGDCLYRSDYKNLWVIPADARLAEIQPKLEARYKIFKLSQALDDLIAEHKFDAVFIDTPPALNFYSMSALMASDRVLVPFDCDAFSASAVQHVAEIVQEVALDHRPQLAIEGIIINHFQAQANHHKNAIESIGKLGFPLLQPYLSPSVVMRESHAARVPLVYYKPAHKLSQEFKALAALLRTSPAKVDKSHTKPAGRSSGKSASARTKV
jgi:chromosome partitioning protein